MATVELLNADTQTNLLKELRMLLFYCIEHDQLVLGISRIFFDEYTFNTTYRFDFMSDIIGLDMWNASLIFVGTL